MASRRHRRGGRYTAPKGGEGPWAAPVPEGYVIVPGRHGEDELVYAPELRQAMREACPECQEADGHAPGKPEASDGVARTRAERGWEPDPAHWWQELRDGWVPDQALACEVCGEEVPITPTDEWTAYHGAWTDDPPMWLCPRHRVTDEEESELLAGGVPERFR